MTRTRTYRGHTTAARVITGIGAVFAAIEVIQLLLILLHANAGNAFARFVASLADPLALFFPGLFPIENPELAALATYGLAAAFWLVVANIVARIVG